MYIGNIYILVMSISHRKIQYEYGSSTTAGSSGRIQGWPGNAGHKGEACLKKSLLEAVSHCTIQPTMYTYVYKYIYIYVHIYIYIRISIYIYIHV